MTPQPSTDDLIAKALAAVGGDVTKLAVSGHEVKRKALHAAAKASRPSFALPISDEDEEKFLAELTKPITDEDRDNSPAAVEYLLLSARESAIAGDFVNTIFDLALVYRKIWGINRRLGEIVVPPPPEKK